MSAADPPKSARGLERACALAAVALVVVLLVPALLFAEATSAAWDAVAQAQCARRVVTLEGGVFVAGTDQKGPLFTWLYVLAWYLAPSGASYWYVIGAFTVALAGATAEVVRRLVLALGGAPGLALGAALLLFVHLTFGEQEYCRLLYSRNLTGLLTAAALLLALRVATTTGRSQALAAAASGTAIGWAMQTMPTSALPASVVAAALVVSLRAGSELPLAQVLRARWHVVAAFAGCALAPLLLVPAWYALRGELADFWVQWWTCNLLYNRAHPVALTERPAAIAAGLARALGHARYLLPLSLVCVALAVEARPGVRAIGARWLLPLAWFVAECAQVSMTLRFFGHYFVLTLVPVCVLGGLAGSRLARGVSPRVLAVVPLLFLVYLAFLGRPLQRAFTLTGAFRGLDTGHEARRRAAPPHLAQVSALLDVVSERDEFVYLWARNVEAHALLLRRSPTRYVENRWLTGEVFLSSGPGVRDERWVLPGVPENWARDVAATPPLAVVELTADPIRPDSPVGRWRAASYRTVLEGPAFRADVDPARWAWVEDALGRARRGVVPVAPHDALVGALVVPDLGDERDATCVTFTGPGLGLGGVLFDEEGDALTVTVYGAEGPTALAEGMAQDPPPQDDTPGELSVLLRSRAVVGVRAGRMTAGRLLRDAKRVVVRLRDDARVTGVGVASGLRPPWARTTP